MSEVLMGLLIYLIFPAIQTLLGAWWIYNAIHAFKEQKYFGFGCYVFLAIHTAFGMLENILEELSV